MKRNKNEVFIEKARAKHGNKYDYSKVEYINNSTNVCIICPEHGEFWQTPSNHLAGKGCMKCGGKMKLTREDFINKSRLVHGNRYDYSKVVYRNRKSKVCIICPEHGEFWQTGNDHLGGCGCPACVGKVKLSVDDFKEKANSVHNFQYDYSMVTNINTKRDKVSIVCPKHGLFVQRIDHHLDGCGCPKCVNEKQHDLYSFTTDDFIKRCNKVHSFKYDYSKVEYYNNRTKVCIICPTHGEFWQSPEGHFEGKGCPKCSHAISKPEMEIIGLLGEERCSLRNRDLLKNGKEIDIFIPSLQLGIEYNGLRWHSEAFRKDKHYHLNKLEECNKQGIELIQLFEDEWVNHRDICESKLKQICGLNDNPKIYGRKCCVREINKSDAYEFLDKNHIQGRTGCTIALGAYHNELLVGVMTFKKEKEGYWDLNRFATDINYQCIGLGGKLFKHFIKHYEFEEIKSFADRRWTTNPTDNLYTKLGFSFHSYVEPTYWYYNPKVGLYKRFHKFGFRKQPLHKQYGLPLTMTELEMTKELGYARIWDCGLIKYIYSKK